jgi:hypothetical protein
MCRILVISTIELNFEVFTVVVLKSIIFWVMAPCSPLSSNRRFGGTYRHLFARWFAEPISSTLKMEAISSSETSVETQRTARRHIPEDDTLQILDDCHFATCNCLVHAQTYNHIYICIFTSTFYNLQKTEFHTLTTVSSEFYLGLTYHLL